MQRIFLILCLHPAYFKTTVRGKRKTERERDRKKKERKKERKKEKETCTFYAWRSFLGSH